MNNHQAIIPTLIFILAILCAIESSTSISRAVGSHVKKFSAGLTFQSSLSLFSRALMSIFMPLLGYAADSNLLADKNLIISTYILVPMLLYLVQINWRIIFIIYLKIINNLIEYGSYFRFKIINSARNTAPKIKKNTIGLLKLEILFVIAYIPYYLAWPLTLLALSAYPDSRGLIIGLSSVLNGINTILIVIFFDPKYLKVNKYIRISISAQVSLLKARTLSSIIAYFILLSIYILYL